MKKWAFAVLLFCVGVQAQNIRYDFQATTVSSYGSQGSRTNQVPLLVLPGAAISFYSCSGDAAFSCITLANTYNAASSTTACPSNAQVVLQQTSICTSNADAQGNAGTWFKQAGLYAYTVTTGTQTYGPYQFTVGGGSGSGSGTPIGVVPTGTIDGTNTTFTLPSAPLTGTLVYQYNGQALTAGVGYTLSGTTVTMLVAPQPGDALYANYLVAGGVSGSTISETPTGAINGTNTTFTLSYTPIAGSLLLPLNGLYLFPSIGYTISGNILTLITAPQTGDTLYAQYSH